MSATPLVRRLRLMVWGVAFAGMGYLLWRYESVRLPADGCSPLVELEPGASLLLDKSPGALHEDQIVLFRPPGEALLLGRVATLPASAPPEYWARLGAGEVWIESGLPGCPSPDSRVLGPISPEFIEGRVLLWWGPSEAAEGGAR